MAMHAPGLRFVLSVIPAVILLLALFAAISAGIDRASNGWGIAAAIGGGISLGLGVMLARAVIRDWRSLRWIAAHGRKGGPAPADGAKLAVDGLLRCDDPLVAPVAGAACAAYVVRISQQAQRSGDDTGTTSVVTAASLSFRPCRLQSDDGDFALRALPELDQGLRIADEGKTKPNRVQALLDALMNVEPAPIEGFDEQRLALRDSAVRAVDDRWRTFEQSPPVDRVRFHEEHLPVDVPITVLAHYDLPGSALVPGRGVFGRVVHAYSGSLDEVAARLGAEVRQFGRVGVVMVFLGIALLALPFVLST